MRGNQKRQQQEYAAAKYLPNEKQHDTKQHANAGYNLQKGAGPAKQESKSGNGDCQNDNERSGDNLKQQFRNAHKQFPFHSCFDVCLYLYFTMIGAWPQCCRGRTDPVL